MAYRSMVAALAVFGSSLASAATLAPVAVGTTSATFDAGAVAALDPMCGAVRPGARAVTASGRLGVSGADPVTEERINVEYRRPAAPDGTRLTLAFTATQTSAGEFGICVHGYRADGVITVADFQPDEAILLGYGELNDEGGRDFAVDVTDLLVPPLNGAFLGLQLSLFGLAGQVGDVSNLRLTARAINLIPEPAALGWLGLGVGAVAARRRRRP